MKQSTKGDNSPNYNAEQMIFVQQSLQAPRGNEVVSMVAVIKHLSLNARDFSYESNEDYRKAFNDKLEEYPEINAMMSSEFIDLSVLYENPYQLGWLAEGVDEVAKKKIALHLRSRSIDLLEGRNPQAAIAALCSELKFAFDDEDSFDESAVRYFILRQFMECNVLPLGAVA